MGTLISVEVWHDDAAHARQCMSVVMQEMHRIDRDMSPYKQESELSRINRLAPRQALLISSELFDLIQASIRISRLSAGAFDITFASAGNLYDYRKALKPDERQLKKILPAINYRHLKLDASNRKISFLHPEVRIDLGGIAKGYAVDRGIHLLKNCGIQNGLVSAGGDTRLLGDRRGRPWMTGIRNPRQEQGSAMVLPLTDTAISTSGDYERFFIENGVRFHHILSPKTGRPSHGVLSATVIGPDATTTDALSTTVFILGPVAGLKLIETLTGIDAVIIDEVGKVHYSSGLMPPSR